MDPVHAGILGFVVLLVVILLGIPVGISLMATGLAGLFYLSGVSATLHLLINNVFTQATSYEFIAVPMFLLMGYVAMAAGLTKPAFETARIWLAPFPGGLAMATSVASGFLGACCGSGIPTTAALSRIAIPEMIEQGYDKGLSAGVVASTASLAVLIPPSIIMVVYAVFMEGVPLGKMLLAGYLPGVVSVAVFIVGISILVRLNPKLAPPKPAIGFTWKQRLVSLKGVWGIGVLFLVLAGGIYSGYFTATEAAGMAALASFILMFLTGKFTWLAVKTAFVDTLQVSGMTFMLLIGALMFSLFLTVSGLPKAAAAAIVAAQLPVTVFLLMVVLMYFILGCFLPSLSMLLLTLPILYPVLLDLKVNLIWFGIIVIKMVEVGGITPPFGIGVYVVKGVVKDEISLTTIFRGIGWFIMMEMATLAILMAFPQISLWLPSAVK
jgi:tripartite ATP-independent transporter DctM subunit